MALDLINLNKACNAIMCGMPFSKAVTLYNVDEDELINLLTKRNSKNFKDMFQIESIPQNSNLYHRNKVRSEKLKELNVLSINLVKLESELKQLDVAPYNTQKLEKISNLKNEISKIRTQINETRKTIIELGDSKELYEGVFYNSLKYEETPKSDYKSITSGSYKADYVQINGIKHFKYEDANPDDLVNLGSFKVQKDLAEKFKEMQAAAKKDGVNLYIVSATRTKKYQVTVFKKKFNDKNNPTESELFSRVKWSAPSGYSEHHTGYAVDLNSTNVNFANTKEYKWLLENAEKYGFEISFPKDNKQNVGFEPWHWRYVGNDETKEIFKLARDFSK